MFCYKKKFNELKNPYQINARNLILNFYIEEINLKVDIIHK